MTGAKFTVINPRDTNTINRPMASNIPPVSADAGMQIYAVPNARGRAAIEGGTVEWKEDTPTRITLQINATQPNAALVLTDQWYPGWTAEMDGKPVPIERDRETGIFRQVSVPAGSHTVLFGYEPTSFRLGAFLAVGRGFGCGANEEKPCRKLPMS
jgi:hypothetical protein